MNQHEARLKGGLATKAKYGASHFSIIGKLGGRPPLTIIPPDGSAGNINFEGGKLSNRFLASNTFTTDLLTLRRIWRAHPLYQASGSAK